MTEEERKQAYLREIMEARESEIGRSLERQVRSQADMLSAFQFHSQKLSGAEGEREKMQEARKKGSAEMAKTLGGILLPEKYQKTFGAAAQLIAANAGLIISMKAVSLEEAADREMIKHDNATRLLRHWLENGKEGADSDEPSPKTASSQRVRVRTASPNTGMPG